MINKSSVERIIAQKRHAELKAFRTSWKESWKNMARDEQKYGHFHILFGRWSGYRAGQEKLVQVMYITPLEKDTLKLKTILYTDQTTMDVWVECLKFEDIIKRNIVCVEQYTDLVRKADMSGLSIYSV